MCVLHSSVREPCLAAQVALGDSCVKFRVQMSCVRRPLDMSRLRKQAVSSPKIIFKPEKQHRSYISDQCVSAAVPEITAK